MPDFTCLINMGCEIVAFDHHAVVIRDPMGFERDLFIEEIAEFVDAFADPCSDRSIAMAVGA